MNDLETEKQFLRADGVALMRIAAWTCILLWVLVIGLVMW